MSAGWPPSKKRPAEPTRSERSRSEMKPSTSACTSRPYPISLMTSMACCWSCSSVGTLGGTLEPGTAPPVTTSQPVAS